ncbi:ABC transporter substrate-binding protein [Acidicapsa ligni]|uniref:ABC transporter substrate-binding protein n=1 Tax=Acidicapsa ligni TaxID=542300 RepID=UPI0021DF6B20|nr:sugar ABC transporter substrate-binding protein [Acidicapsa ligni]
MTTLRIALRKYIDFENAMAALIEKYTADNPGILIEAVPLDLETLYAELFNGDGLPSSKWDMAFVVTDWLADAVASGIIENLAPYMDTNPLPDWPDGWARSLIKPLDFEGKYYCIPWHDGPESLIYRRDLFESHAEQATFRTTYGYDLQPPQTWQQFEDIARFFTRPEAALYGTLFACYPDGHNTLYDFALQVWSRGGELHDNSGKPSLFTDQSVAALDFYRRIVRDPALCHPHSINFDSVQSGDNFLSGTIAMMVNWFGFASRAGCAGGALDGKVSLAPIPRDPGLLPASLSVFWNIAISSGSKHKQAAYDFLRFLAQPESDREAVRHGVVGVRLSTWRDPEVQRTVPAFREIESISHGARQLPRSPDLPEFAEIVNQIIVDALHTDESSSSILKRAQQTALEKNIHFQ